MNNIDKKTSVLSLASPKWRARLNFFVFFVCTLMLSACTVDLYQGLSEKQANIMLSTLLKNGIDSEKVAQGKNGFSIVVDEENLVQALDILSKNNLPGEDFKNLGDIFKGDGMIASASEENARMAYAISQELSNTFSTMDGVLTARVHIVLGSADKANDTFIEPSASIFIRHTPESTIPNYVSQLREMTSKAVPNLNAKSISITLMPVRDSISTPRVQSTPFLTSLIHTMQSSPLIVALLLICALGIVLYTVRIIMAFIKTQKEKKQVSE